MTVKQKNVFYIFLFLLLSIAVGSCVRIPSADDFPNADGGTMKNQQLGTVRNLIVSQSYRKIGIPYRYGGSTTNSFDCSGLTQYVYREAGIKIPRTTKHQLRESQTISYQQLLPGDLAFYKTSTKSRHVGIYIGNNQMIHASTGSKQVRKTNITNSYWRQRFTKFGRFVK
jgi:cell wall-associated NlpC family hydrolase